MTVRCSSSSRISKPPLKVLHLKLAKRRWFEPSPHCGTSKFSLKRVFSHERQLASLAIASPAVGGREVGLCQVAAEATDGVVRLGVLFSGAVIASGVVRVDTVVVACFQLGWGTAAVAMYFSGWMRCRSSLASGQQTRAYIAGSLTNTGRSSLASQQTCETSARRCRTDLV